MDVGGRATSGTVAEESETNTWRYSVENVWNTFSSDRAGALINKQLPLKISAIFKIAGVAELVDAPDSKSGFFGSASSILALGTI